MDSKKWFNRRIETNGERNYNHFAIPASIIASILFMTTPKDVVLAETEDTNEALNEIQSLYNEFHTYIHTEETEEVEDTEEIEELQETETEGQVEEAAPELVSENEEIQLIKEQLLSAIEKAGSEELASQLHSSNLTIEQLDAIFEEVVTELVEQENQEEGSATAISLPDEVEVEADETDENLEEVDETTEVAEIDETDESEEDSEITEETTEEVATDAETTQKDEGFEEAVAETEEEPKAEEQADVALETVATSAEFDQPKSATFSARQAPANENEEETTVYVVKAGDTLNNIANRYGTTADALASLNNLPNKNTIFPGQRLVVNGKVDTKPTEDLSELNQKLTNDEFIDVVGEHARVIAADHNLYASVMTAQAALESGFGGSALSSAPNYNLFGIKGSYNGESVNMRTSEYFGNWERINASFKKYPSYKESLLDNARLLRYGLSWDSSYYAGTWLENAPTYQDATAWLEGRYATDPNYSSKLNNIISRYDLTQFDTHYVTNTPTAPEAEVKPAPKPTTPASNPVTPSTSKNYKVKRGDTLSQISLAYNMSVSELKQLNGLRSDTIYVGQTLKVKGKASQPASKPDPVATPEKLKGGATNYTVKAGDTLSHISIAYDMSLSELKQLNNLNSNTIYVGQTLKVKAETSKLAQKPVSKPASEKEVQTTTPITHAATYRVKAGDTLSHISLAHNMSISELKQLNDLSSDTIYVGQTLKVKTEVSKPAPKPALNPAPAPAPEKTKSSTFTYTVDAGDTLSHISLAHNMSVSELKQLNGLKSDIIYVGQTLKVKGQVSKPAPVKPETKPVTPVSNTGTYTVKAGDTLSHISNAYNTIVSELKQLNGLKSDTIYVGQTLKVKGQAPKPAPTKPEAKPVTPSSSTATYKVKAGDTLSHISNAYNTSVSELKQLNGLKSDIIYVGQTLKVKGQAPKPAPAKPEAKPVTPSSSSATYKVKAGDTLSHISKAYKMSVSELKQLNNLKSDLIFVGQTLKVKVTAQPDSIASSTSKASTSNKTHRVTSGDTLSEIAVKFNTTVGSLKEKNQLKSDVIYIGQLLNI